MMGEQRYRPECAEAPLALAEGLAAISRKEEGPPQPTALCFVTREEHNRIVDLLREEMHFRIDGYEALKIATVKVLGQDVWDQFQGHVVGYRVVDEVPAQRFLAVTKNG